MLVLALDTATAAVTAGLAWLAGPPDNPTVEVRAERVTVDARRHGEALAPGIRECFAATGTAPGGLAAVVAGVGPGPFTGLRVGLVTAAALADALGVPAYGVCTLDALAGDSGPVLVATDARRREVYWATYSGDGRRVTGPAVEKPASVRAWLDGQADPPRRAAGAGAELYADVLGLPVAGPAHPPVFALVRLAADRILAGAPGEGLTPLYLRRPDAVEPSAPKPVRT